PVLELDIGRHGRGKLDQGVVQKRHARLQAVGHAHPVLHVQERGQQGLEIKVRHAIEIRLFLDIVGAEDALEGLIDGVALQHVPVELLAQSRSTVDQTEVAPVKVLEKSSRQNSWSRGLYSRRVTRLGIMDS